MIALFVCLGRCSNYCQPFNHLLFRKCFFCIVQEHCILYAVFAVWLLGFMILPALWSIANDKLGILKEIYNNNMILKRFLHLNCADILNRHFYFFSARFYHQRLTFWFSRLEVSLKYQPLFWAAYFLVKKESWNCLVIPVCFSDSNFLLWVLKSNDQRIKIEFS